MGQLDKDGILTLQELMITALATADVVAKLLIDKGLVSQKEYDLKLFSDGQAIRRCCSALGECPSIPNATHYDEFYDWDSHGLPLRLRYTEKRRRFTGDLHTEGTG